MALTSQQQFLIDFRLYQVPTTLGLDVPPAAAALMLGVSEEAFTAELAKVSAEVEQAAHGLLADAEVSQALKNWNLAHETTLLFVGDSITALRRSYAEILNVMLKKARSEVNLRFLNVAQSGFTSANGLQDTYTSYLEKNPDWVFILFGTNDAQHIESITGRSLVSLNEYGDNLRAIVNAFQQHTKARIMLITPPPLIEETANVMYGGLKIAYGNSTVFHYADAARKLAGELSIPCIDLFALFGENADPNKFSSDGLHPNLAGQGEIVRQLLRQLDAK